MAPASFRPAPVSLPAKALLRNLLLRVVLPRPKRMPEPHRVRRILVYGSMGIDNMVMFTPALQAIRDLYPMAEITMLVRGQGSEHVIEHGGLVDEIIRTRRDIRETLALTWRLRRRRFDVLFSTFHGGPFRCVTAFAGVPWRVGHVSSGGWRNTYDDLFNLPVAMADGEHEIERYMRLPRLLGYRGETPRPAFYLSHEDEAAAERFLAERGVAPDHLLVGVQIDSSPGTDWRRWPLERFAAVCNALSANHDARIVVLGSVRSFAGFDRLTAMLERPPLLGVEDMPIGPAAAVVRRCRLAICNDSGFMHIAGALGTPVVGLFGPSDFTRVSPLPYGPQHRLVRHDVPCGPCVQLAGSDVAEACLDRICLSHITPGEVIAMAGEVLRGQGLATRTGRGGRRGLAT